MFCIADWKWLPKVTIAPKRKPKLTIKEVRIYCDICMNVCLVAIFYTGKRLEFEKRRKAHYNEFDAVRRARQLMEAEEDEDDDDTNAVELTPADKKKHKQPSERDNSLDLDNVDEHCMDVDETTATQSTSSASTSIGASASVASTST